MPENHRYESALKSALSIIHTVDRPGMTRQAKLASITYAVLDAIYEAEASSTPLPGSGPAVQHLPAPPKRRSRVRSKPPAPR